MKKVVVISSHPDDEILGAGGTLLKHSASGDQLFWIIITKISVKLGYSKKIVRKRNEEIKLIKNEIGFSDVFNLNFNTSELSSLNLNQIINKISKIFNKINPNTIYCVNRSDAHSDHRITFDAVMACTKSFRYPSINKVLLYECISETEFAPAIPEKIFQPNYFVDITNFIEKKIELMNIYESEIGIHPFPRSNLNIKSLSIFRGASVGVNNAEAFQLIKFIDK